MEANTLAEFTLPQQYTTQRSSAPRWVLAHARRQWLLLTMLFIGALGNAVLAAVVPVLIGRALNMLLEAQVSFVRLGQLVVWLGISQVVRGVLQFGRNFGAEWVAQRLERDIRDELYANLLGKSMTFHSLQSVGDTMARATNDVHEINLMFSPGVNLVIGSLLFLVMPIVLAPGYHPALLLTPVAFTVLYAVTIFWYLRRLSPIADAVRDAFGRLNGRLSEALDGIETVKGAAQEEAEVALFEHNARNYRDATVRQGDIESTYLPLLLFSIALAGGLLHALLLNRSGLLDIGQVVGYFGLLLMLDFPTFISLFAYSQISLGMAGARRILELMNQENNLDQNAAGYSQPMRGAVKFHQVSFTYNGSTDPALQEISFQIEPGQTVAIVGQTGSAKTTLARLVNRTYDPQQGQVCVDGVDVRDWNLAALRRSISIIEQDIFLFSRSVAENIAFGRPGATAAEIEAAARAAQAHEFILSFKDGYDTVIGERGVTLSGGQRQRLALARAFLTDPRILILDDSTSAIDSATEDQIQRAIYAAAQGRTTLMITHRLSQIRWADLILVLRKGRLVASGSHEDLMRTSEAYRRLFE